MDILDVVRAKLGDLLPETQVARIIRELRAEFGGDAVYITKLDRVARNQRVREVLSSGGSLRTAARIAGCARDTARRAGWEL